VRLERRPLGEEHSQETQGANVATQHCDAHSEVSPAPNPAGLRAKSKRAPRLEARMARHRSEVERCKEPKVSNAAVQPGGVANARHNWITADIRVP
jgi:hypothetical protein